MRGSAAHLHLKRREPAAKIPNQCHFNFNGLGFFCLRSPLRHGYSVANQPVMKNGSDLMVSSVATEAISSIERT